MPVVNRRVPWLGGVWAAGFLSVLILHGISCGDNTGPPQAAAVRIEPTGSLSVLPGESYQLKAIATDNRGSELVDPVIAWISGDTSVATVDGSGLVSAQSPGVTLIMASADTATADVLVDVLTPVAKISVNPPASALLPGQTLQLAAAAEDESGGPIRGRAVQWATSDSSVATASTTGLVTGLRPGSATVTATTSKKSGTASVTVLAPISGLRLTPRTATLQPGQTLRLTAATVDSNGNVVQGRSIDWTVSDPEVASVSDSGLVRAARVGTAFVIAEAEGQRDSTLLEVEAAVRSVAVNPDRATLRPGAALQLEVSLRDDGGKALTGRELAWTSSDPDVATVSASGQVKAGRPGQASITATSGGKAGRSSITVQEPVATVTLTPASKRLTLGEVVQFVAKLRAADGRVLTGRTVTWSSERSSVAQVSSTGEVTARGEGTTDIEATSEGVDGEATVEVSQPAGEPVVLVGAGDIATCTGTGDEQTARLLDEIPGLVFLTGDNAYPNGSDEDYTNCYEPTWGRHKARTLPIPGNREYLTPGAQGYFNYFGSAAGDRSTGYYSFDLGGWHILALNTQFTGKRDSPQAEWVKADLAAHPAKCTMAIWHVPLFGPDSVSVRMHHVWELLREAGAELVLNGHEHNYQRFVPQTAAGVADPERGIREIIVGTGGKGVGVGDRVIPNREVAYGGGFGVLKLLLYADSYSWEFISVAGKTFTDSGSASCH